MKKTDIEKMERRRARKLLHDADEWLCAGEFEKVCTLLDPSKDYSLRERLMLLMVTRPAPENVQVYRRPFYKTTEQFIIKTRGKDAVSGLLGGLK